MNMNPGTLTLPTSIRFLIAATIASSCAYSHASSDERPNVLFIMSDDHTTQAISAYGGRLASVCPTPNIDRLANEGMLFNNCFVTNSICSPSRAAILTGKYSHKNGVYKFSALDQTQPTLPKIMQSAGYHTSLIGKYHLHSNPAGMDYFSILPGQGDYHNPEFIRKGEEHPSGWVQLGKRTVFEGHSSDVIADQALDYLKNKRPADEPFLLFCHFKAPHDSWEFAERYREFLEDVDILEPVNLFDDYEGRTDMLKKQLQYIGSEWGDHTNFERETSGLEGRAKKKMQYQLYMKKYLRCVKGVDDNVGRLLTYLDDSGLADNTVVMYTGDQGFFLGEHGLYDKRIMYEEALRMPCLVRWPQQVEPGTKSDGMILNVDFAPTIAGIAGLQVPADMQGRSFLPLLQGNLPKDWRNSMYYRYYFSHFETESHYGVRTYRHKLIHFDQLDQWELYDLEKDPHEMHNVYEDPQYQQVVMQLKQELKRLQTELDDDPADIGDKPWFGDLDPQPLFTTKEAYIGKGDTTVVVRFRTDVGGTLFSKCDLDEDIESRGGNIEATKVLSIFESGVRFFYGDEEPIEIDANPTNNLPRTLALVVRNRKPYIYLDGEQLFAGKRSVPDDDPDHTFNVGAGLDDGGWLGHNFKGEISSVLTFDRALEQQEISKLTKDEKASIEPVMNWKK